MASHHHPGRSSHSLSFLWLQQILILILQLSISSSDAFLLHITSKTPPAKSASTTTTATNTLLFAKPPSWNDVEAMMAPAIHAPTPSNIDSVLTPEKPNYSSERPTLFRERHGWCPYSERVWLTLELLDIPYDTIRIDNTGGGRPSWYAGQTPQMRWPDGRIQGESYDLVQALLDTDRGDTQALKTNDADVNHCVNIFRNIFPRARPSSRAAFLFQYNGEPLWKSTFEETLQKTDDLLGKTQGPFFCGNDVTGADIAWAPFLERYRYQLPCLHQGLQPDDASSYPHLSAWYQAMNTQLPAYACRVQGDASSWRKVLTMAGFGNAGLPPNIAGNMEELVLAEQQAAASQATTMIVPEIWKQYAASRPYVAESPQKEAALIMTRNRERILADALKRGGDGLPMQSEEELDTALRELAMLLFEHKEECDNPHVGALARFLDERMCVPRDMGAMSAAAMKHLANKLH